jgi:hypothetical protein
MDFQILPVFKIGFWSPMKNTTRFFLKSFMSGIEILKKNFYIWLVLA